MEDGRGYLINTKMLLLSTESLLEEAQAFRRQFKN